MSSVRPIRLVTESALKAARSAADKAAAEWASRWLGAGSTLSVAVAAADAAGKGSDGTPWLCCRSASADVWLEAGALAAMAAALLGSHGSSVIAACVARTAANELLLDVAAAHGAPADGPVVGEAPRPQHLRQFGRVVLAVTLGFDAKSSITLLIERHAVAASDRPAAERRLLQPAQAAVGDQPVDVEVSLGQVEIDLGLLRSLSVGDVLRLDRALDAGADVRVCGKRVACVGYLGARDGRRAVALARP